MRFISRGVAIVAIAALSACASQGTRSGADKPKLDDLAGVPRVDPPGALKDPKHDNLNAVLWSQTAAENRALATQAFNQAARTLADADLVGCHRPDPVPRARRRQPRPDGLEHAASGSSADAA